MNRQRLLLVVLSVCMVWIGTLSGLMGAFETFGRTTFLVAFVIASVVSARHRMWIETVVFAAAAVFYFPLWPMHLSKYQWMWVVVGTSFWFLGIDFCLRVARARRARRLGTTRPV